jgi:hypothetical protein
VVLFTELFKEEKNRMMAIEARAEYIRLKNISS